MKYLGLMVFAAALVGFVCGCPQTAPQGGAGETKLLEKFKTEGDAQKVTILYVTSRGCGTDAALLYDQLKSIANFSDKTIKLITANADEDHDLKKAYGFVTYPVTMIFDEKGELALEIVGTRYEVDEVKNKATELGGKAQGPEKPKEGTPEGETEEPAKEEPEKGEEEGGESGG
jgi:hypothetical protein